MSKLFQFIKIIRPGDAFIIISFLAIIFWAISRSWNMPSGQYLKIESNFEDPIIFSLNQSANKNISGFLGSSVISINEGKARFVKSPCTKKYCIHHGWIDKVNQTIVCLPNQITISIVGNSESYDTVNY
ncbi:NusG domain II-containing protein [Methylophilaceae bacterium]|nr:NusG domain II-containing protein [Methylophilaceae bacterium]MDC0115114.1 NusG domain II-containing protein [Methylophilaceae bacterium]MDC0128753.1 NusG domain II-containing protein [Methylophilaceae bacterium]MDC0877421.1 NusG domain II-containing protein [Methylophilaceae bacterium]